MATPKIAADEATAQSEPQLSRFCLGLIYCEVTSGDTKLPTGLLWLYSSEQRGTFSRWQLIPFYARESDPAARYIHRSVLWPLGISEQKGEESYFHILPLFWNAEDRTRQYTVVVPVYFDYSKDIFRYTYLFPPVYGHHSRGELYDRYFLFGPLMIATYDKEIDLKTWDLLFPLLHYGSDRSGYEARVFPVYWSGGNHEEGSWYRHLAPLYWAGQSHQTGTSYHHVLPLYLSGEDRQEDSSYQHWAPLIWSGENRKVGSSYFHGAPLYWSGEHRGEGSWYRYFAQFYWSGANDREHSWYRNVLLLAGRSVTAQTDFGYLFPLGGSLTDVSTEETRTSLLGLPPIPRTTMPSLSFYEHTSKSDAVSDRFFPLPAETWHFAPLFYHCIADGSRTRWSSLGLPHMGPFPALSLVSRERTPALSTFRLFPLYAHRWDGAEGEELRWSAIGLSYIGKEGPAFSLISREHTPTLDAHRAFPLYAYRRDVGSTERMRVSALGLPHWGEARPALSLFAREQTPTLHTHRFFPVYSYARDDQAGTLDGHALLLWWYRHDAEQARDTVFPLGSWRQSTKETRWNFSALGVEPLSLVEFDRNPTGRRYRFFPVWDYGTEAGTSRFSLVGAGQAALYARELTATGSTAHVFPLWWYQHSPEGSMNVFFPLWSKYKSERTRDESLGVVGIDKLSFYHEARNLYEHSWRLFPFADSRYLEATQERHTGALGLYPVSLYYGYTSQTASESRFFPFWRYTSDLVRDQAEFWFLRPLFDYKSAQGRTTEVSLLWWLFGYRSPDPDHKEFWLLGHDPVAIYMRQVSPTRTLNEVNPVLPVWRREYVEGVGTSVTLFGGLFGWEAMPDGTHKVRLFWGLRL